MVFPDDQDDTGSLERARARLYAPNAVTADSHARLAAPDERELPHAWRESPIPDTPLSRGKRHVRFAGIFFAAAFVFFIISLAITGYFFYFGGNSVSINKISIGIQGPTTIAAGDTVPLSLLIENKNSVPIENATIEIDFPDGSRSASNVLNAYPRYTENLGTIASGATISRSVKAIVFGAAGQTLSLPVSFSYSIAGSNAIFVKKSSYTLTVSSTPLSLSVATLAETVSGKPLTLTLTVRSNATVPLDNVVLSGVFPFGFSVASSSLPLSNSSILLGSLLPGANKTITITGVLSGQDGEQRVFHFSVGTAKTPSDQTPSITYMTQDATVAIAAPFIDTTISLNGNTAPGAVVQPGSTQNVTVSYANTLATNVTNATITIALSGSAVDYGSIQTSNGFYNSANHSIVFSQDTDPALASLAPGASGIGVFSFSTLPAGVPSPTIFFTISESGTRIGQTNVPEQVSASLIESVKVTTAVLLTNAALHTSGPFANSGPIPPRANQATTYTVVWTAQNEGSAVAGGSASATLPSYVSYDNKTSGTGSFSYDPGSRTVTWDTGDLAQNASAQGAFQVVFTPSTSQKNSAPALTGGMSFSGYDRFAGVQISATAPPATTATAGDPGYVSADANVQ
ncbi:MAG: COG1361 family protein [Minisyncoccota bacterium]